MNNQLWQRRRLWHPILGVCDADLLFGHPIRVQRNFTPRKRSALTVPLCVCRTFRLRSMPTMTSTRAWTGTSQRWSRLWAARRRPCSSNTGWMTWINAGATSRPNQPTLGQYNQNLEIETDLFSLSRVIWVRLLRCSFAALRKNNPHHDCGNGSSTSPASVSCFTQTENCGSWFKRESTILRRVKL